MVTSRASRNIPCKTSDSRNDERSQALTRESELPASRPAARSSQRQTHRPARLGPPPAPAPTGEAGNRTSTPPPAPPGATRRGRSRPWSARSTPSSRGALVFPCETEITNGFSDPVPGGMPGGPLTAGRGKDAARKTGNGLPLYRPDRLGCRAIHRIGGNHHARCRSGPGPLSFSDHLSAPDDIAGPHPRIATFPQARSPDGR